MGKGLKHKARSSPTRKDYGRETNSIAKKGSRGDFVPFRLPLAESRGGASGGVWGNAPTTGRATIPKEAASKGCRQRSVPASNFALPQERPQAALSNIYAVSRQMGATDYLRCPHSSDNHHPMLADFQMLNF